MLGLQLLPPPPPPHVLARHPSMDMYTSATAPSSSSFAVSSYLAHSTAVMQLPCSSMTAGHQRDALATLSQPSLPHSAVQLVSLATDQGASHHVGHQLSAIGSSASLTAQARSSPQPQSQPQQQPQPTSSRERPSTARKECPIPPGLMVPSTIPTPQQGLPQLAAEITCLFWFESSATLKKVAEGGWTGQRVPPLVQDAYPTAAFKRWVTTILTTTQVAQNVILLALLFIYRLKLANTTVYGRSGSEYRLLTVALMLGNKFLDDNTYTNKTWAEVSGISVQEVHIMEVEFLSNMRYSLFTTKDKWDQWHTILGHFSTFFHHASRLSTAITTPSPTAALVPLLVPRPVVVPSPSAVVVQPSPPASSSLCSSGHPALSNPLLSPAPSLPELGPMVRKRSTDHSAEPALKRQAHGLASGPYSHASSLCPSLQQQQQQTTPLACSFHPSPPVSRLPALPTLSVPAAQQQQQQQQQQMKNWSELAPSIAGPRAMAMMYQSGLHWQQPVGTPTSTPTSTPAFADSYIPALDPSRQLSPFPLSAGSSPAASYPASGSRQLSPSYFLNQRQSPYRPVRAVHTLLVPPLPAAMHNSGRRIAYDQMQYQPLGRPSTERRTGYVPYMDRSAWPEQNQFNQLPPPSQPVFR